MNRRKVSFDGWVLDRESGDLSRDGNRQRLQELPLKVLGLLLASPDGLVTREQLIKHLWPKGVVDFDTGLNTAVRKLRVALGDVTDAPRYIETIPRRGYRFVGTIDPDPPSAAEPTPVPFVAPPIEEPASGGEKQPVEGGKPIAPTLALQELVRDTAPVPDRSVDLSIQNEPGSATKPRRRMFFGIAATLALSIGVMYWLLHRVATPPVVTSSIPTPALPDQSVAVLPFESLSTEPNNEFLALGIAETVLHRLASLRDLTVIGRTSSFVFKNRNEDARQIGRALNARYLVEGSVQRAGERLRVQAQLIDAASGKQLWSLAFDRPLADIFALQDEIAGLIAQNLVRPVRMEIWVMDADGSHQHQVTNLGGANFAPYYHPDGQRIIFASNYKNPRSRNFDLYLVNQDGTGLEQITTNTEFDAFPMFSPDGRQLVWASNRNGKVQGETNIFIADWVDNP